MYTFILQECTLCTMYCVYKKDLGSTMSWNTIPVNRMLLSWMREDTSLFLYFIFFWKQRIPTKQYWVQTGIDSNMDVYPHFLKQCPHIVSRYLKCFSALQLLSCFGSAFITCSVGAETTSWLKSRGPLWTREIISTRFFTSFLRQIQKMRVTSWNYMQLSMSKGSLSLGELMHCRFSLLGIIRLFSCFFHKNTLRAIIFLLLV